jgi:hypothetical protein
MPHGLFGYGEVEAMKRRWNLALALAVSCWPMSARAQSTNPANQELIGTGPKIEVQTSANATIDVGGAGAANTNVTGQNLRGNLGATIPQPERLMNPALPAATLPANNFAVPDLGPNLRGLAPDALGRKPTQKDIRIATELILPRFRDDLENGNTRTSQTGAASEAWRYRNANGRWWYWKPNKTWAYWNGRQWLDYSGRG